MSRILLTMGDAAGIGPEILVKAAAQQAGIRKIGFITEPK